jgi:hypothetical protein
MRSASISDTGPVAADRSPVTYLGYGRGQRFSSPEDVAKDALSSYSLPLDGLGADHWALEGKWTIGPEAFVTLDGKSVSGGDVRGGTLRIDAERLYQLIDRNKPAKGTVRIRFRGRARVYAFTFG